MIRKKRLFLTSLILVCSVWFLLMAVISYAQEPERGYLHAWGDKMPFKGVTILVSMLRLPMSDAVRASVPEFEKMTGMKVTIEDVPYLTLREKQVIDLSTKTGTYDVLFVDTSWQGEYIKADYIYPLNDFAKKYNTDLEGFVPSLLEYHGYHPFAPGVLVGLPATSATVFYWYRKDMFEKYSDEFQAEYGWKLRPARNPEEFRQISEFFTGWDWDEDGTNEYGVGIWGLRGEHIVADWYPLLWGYGGETYDKDYNVTINDAAGQKAIEYYASLKPFAPPGVGNWGHDEVVRGLREGLVVQTHAGLTETAPYLEEDGSPVRGKIGYAVLPWTENPTGKSYHVMGGYSISISQFSKHREAAYAFLDWVTSAEIMSKTAYLGSPPCRTADFEDSVLIGKAPWLSTFLESLKTARSRPPIPEYPRISEAMALGLSGALVGTKPPKQAINEIAKGIHDILEKAGYYKK